MAARAAPEPTPRAPAKPEHRVQYNYDVFAQYPEKEHYSLPIVTAADLAQQTTRPRSVRMLTRDFIHDSLYHPQYGYFSRQAVLLPPERQALSEDVPLNAVFPFHDIKNETEFMKAVQMRYMDFEHHFEEERRAQLQRRRHQEPSRAEQLESLMEQQRRTAWGSAERLELAQAIGRLQRDMSQDRVSDTEVDAMAAGQVWHTPTQLFSPHYGRAIARYLLAEYKLHLFPYHDLVIYELGGGAGTLAKDILDYIRMTDIDVYERTRYHIVEISERLVSQQRARLAAHTQSGAVQVVHRDFLEWDTEVTDPCFVVALEVLDNLTHDVVRYSTDDLQPYQGLVSIDHTGDFTELWEPAKDPLILQYLQLLSAVRPTMLPPGAPFYLNWIPPAMRSYLHHNAPFYPNLTQPHYVPTGALKMLQVLKKYFPLHRLVLSDFSSLPDACAGVNGPVVQTRHNGVMIPVTTYCVLQGFFDIFFPTDFELLRDMYLRFMELPDGEPRVSANAAYDSFPPSFFSKGETPLGSTFEDFSAPTPRTLGASDILPPPLLSDTMEARIMSHAEFLMRYAEAQGTQLRDGSNPMVSWYANACWLLT